MTLRGGWGLLPRENFGVGRGGPLRKKKDPSRFGGVRSANEFKWERWLEWRAEGEK